MTNLDLCRRPVRAMRAFFGGSVLPFITLATSSASATVTEPNGVMVPGPPYMMSETSLQDFFDGEGESINAATEAAAEPGAFFPACGGIMRARLVLNQSQGAAGVSWYNVPGDATSAPGQVYALVPPNTALGTVFDVNLAGDSRYAGGAIGFVLTKAAARVYYSEFRRNANCSACTMPGYWKMMLVYSADAASTFYLAWEDWEGADSMSWQGNDGDMNDQVFYVEGLRTTSCSGMGGAGGMGNGGTAGGGSSSGGTAGTASGSGGRNGGTSGSGQTGGKAGEGGTTTTGGNGGTNTEGGTGATTGGSSARGGTSSGGTGGDTGGTGPGPGGEGGEPGTTGGRSPGNILGDSTRDARTDAPDAVDEDSGCGCRIGSSNERGWWTLLALGSAGLLFGARRRRR